MKKTISLFTLTAFIIFSVSCTAGYSVKQMGVRTAVEGEGGDIEILGVMKTSGEYIRFSKKQDVRIGNNTIEGKTFDTQEWVSIPWSEISYIQVLEANKIQTQSIILAVIVLAAFVAGCYFMFDSMMKNIN